MASIEQSSVFNFPQNGGLGLRLSQSDIQFNWRNDPSVIPCREYVTKAIQVYLAQNASGEFGQQIAELASYLENQMFMGALSKEDYMNKENFHGRLQVLIQRKWVDAKSAQQESMHSTTFFPMYNAAPTFGMLSNFGAAQNKPLPDYMLTANPGSNVVQADTLNQSRLQADVQRSAASGSRKRTFDATLEHPEQVLPNSCSPREVFSCVGPADSGPTFSGSVLQYDSEASFESHNIINQHFTEGECNPILLSSQSSPSVHTPSMVGENSKLEAFHVSDEVLMQQTMLESPRITQQQSQPKLQFDEHLLRNDGTSARISVESRNLYGSHDTLSRAILLPCCEEPGSGNVRQSSADKLLCYYITYTKHPLLRGKSKFPFLEYLHSQKCNGAMCSCEEYKLLFSHFDNCGSADCCICGPAIRTCSAGLVHPGLKTASNSYKSLMCASDFGGTACLDKSEDLMNPAKSRKLNSTFRANFSSCGVSALVEDAGGQKTSESPVEVNPDAQEGHAKMCKSDPSLTSIGERDNNAGALIQGDTSGGTPNLCDEPSADCKQKIESATPCELNDTVNDDFQTLPSECLSEQTCVAQHKEVATGNHPEETRPEISGEGSQPTVAKLEKQKVDGITLIDFFSAGEIRQHIASLKQQVDQIMAEDVAGSTASCSSNENCCQICASDRLVFAPMPIYCSACGMRIKNYGNYYSPKDENRAQICFCSICYNKARGGCITYCGVSVAKNNLVMKRNNLISEESWVQCDRCEGWQHQVCALFNDKRDLGGKAEYICPNCYLEDLENKLRMPLPRSCAFDARNLPQTLLSGHIEQRLFSRLKQEREDRAKAGGKAAEEVLEPADLAVRVVSSVDKRLKVKEQFLNIFPEKNYPAEFPYRSKVILLFQRIEGVDVCLFAMYVQEFGSECSPPNQRCIYISYLDSVKYFRPEMKAVSGEALRTFVYHEILVGYLDYCKKRGFATCYIWACPPVKGEDYILYCHPETQKTPRPDKLRHWYQSVLKKASKENIVVNFTNLYEKFFVPTGECNTKVTAARLPYFDGDYWSSVAETMIKKIEQEDMEMKVKKMTRRSLKSMGHINPSADEVKDILLMQELGQSISSAKEDFIIVYLQFVCTHCHEVILSGKRWFCTQCKNFQLCERCHGADQNSTQGDMHISSSGQKHALAQEMVNDVPVDTEDNDSIMDNCFLENRHALLSFCQGNHYQFDSLRRAKHSSMMILYHLQNPNSSSGGTFCSLCLKDLGADQRWKCEICPELNVCSMCYQRSNASCHNHTLSCHLPTSRGGAENKLTKMVRELLDVILHASHCQTTNHLCSYPNCTLIRRLFSHAHACKIRVAGGCCHCRKTWFILMMHSRRCKDSDCNVPRCLDLKKYAERIELQSRTQRSKNPPDVHLH